MNHFASKPDVLDIPELDEFLHSDTETEAMSLSIMDGFLTAIAIGPEIIMPSEWMPCIFGLKSPNFKSEQQAQAVFGAIMEWYNGILKSLSEAPKEYEPFLSYDEDDQTIFADWAIGFLTAMDLRSDAWAPLYHSEQYSFYLVPIVAHLPDQVSESLYNLAYQRLSEDPDCLADSVIKIDRFWKQTRQHYEGRSKIGRNKPCRCGSGKKFKKCCGTN